MTAVGLAVGCRCGEPLAPLEAVQLVDAVAPGLRAARGLSADGAELDVWRALDGRSDTSYCLRRGASGDFPQVTLRLPAPALPEAVSLGWEAGRGPEGVEVALIDASGGMTRRWRAEAGAVRSGGVVVLAPDAPLRRVRVKLDAPIAQDAVCLTQLTLWLPDPMDLEPVDVSGAWAAPVGVGTAILVQDGRHVSGCTDDGAQLDGVVRGAEVWLRGRKVGFYETRMTLVRRSDGHLMGGFEDDRNRPGQPPMLIDVAPARGLEVPCEHPPSPPRERLIGRWLDGDPILLREGDGPLDASALAALRLAVSSGEIHAVGVSDAIAEAEAALLADLGLRLVVDRNGVPGAALGPRDGEVLYAWGLGRVREGVAP